MWLDWKGTFEHVYSNDHRHTTVLECDGLMTWHGVKQSKFLAVNADGVLRPDTRYQGWYYRIWNNAAAWEYFRFTSTGAMEGHHFCDTCTGTSPLGSPKFCCSFLTTGGEPCNGGNQFYLNGKLLKFLEFMHQNNS